MELWEALFELAHGIKGAAAGLGFKRLAKAAKDLESRSKTLTIITSRTELAELEKALSQVMCFIELKKVAVEKMQPVENILIIDDDPINTMVLKNTLEKTISFAFLLLKSLTSVYCSSTVLIW